MTDFIIAIDRDSLEFNIDLSDVAKWLDMREHNLLRTLFRSYKWNEDYIQYKFRPKAITVD